jgi:hypothetical protein
MGQSMVTDTIFASLASQQLGLCGPSPRIGAPDPIKVFTTFYSLLRIEDPKAGEKNP